MLELFGPREIPGLRRAGKMAAATLSLVESRLRAGIATAQIDRWVRADTAARGGRCSQLGYRGFPAAVCTSRNHVVCHGIPHARERLNEGDIINIDVTSNVGGYHGDNSATYFIGRPSAESRHVVDVARRCRDVGIQVVRAGVRLGEIGTAIETLAQREGCSVVREYGGHGIGRTMHAAPHVPHVRSSKPGMRLRAGMVITIEPMINLGGPEVVLLEDGWTVVTADRSLSAQFEHTILVTEQGAEILTVAPGDV